jgi:Cu(I)/Ag(I) efflux system periplasmic protein CusF
MKRIIHRSALGAVGVVLAAAALAQAPTAGGEVAKVDKAASRITLKHSGIKNLDMPPMSMTFRVRDAKMLDDLAVGDRVRFVAERVDGQYTLTALSKAP